MAGPQGDGKQVVQGHDGEGQVLEADGTDAHTEGRGDYQRADDKRLTAEAGSHVRTYDLL